MAREGPISRWRLRLRYGGRRYECPCCGGRFRRLHRANPAIWDSGNAICPACGSKSRHRALLVYLRAETQLFSRDVRVLHFAPEDFLARHLERAPGIEYVTADLDPRLADVRADMTELPFAEGSFDIVIASHVLEHIPDDHRALLELQRVLRPGGTAFLQQPIRYSQPTYEDSSIEEAAGRERAFGQRDHVRVYGHDFPDRLEAAGFDVELFRCEERLPPETVARYALEDLPGTFKGDDIYICRKPVDVA